MLEIGQRPEHGLVNSFEGRTGSRHVLEYPVLQTKVWYRKEEGISVMCGENVVWSPKEAFTPGDIFENFGE